MNDADWERGDAHVLGVFLNGKQIPNHDRDGNPLVGASFLLPFNAHHEPLPFAVPPNLGDAWTTVIGSDSAADYPDGAAPGEELALEGRSLLILRRDRDESSRVNGRVATLGVTCISTICRRRTRHRGQRSTSI